jgi:signal transduction histidine kinase
MVGPGVRIVLAFAVIASALRCTVAAAQEVSHRTVLTIHWGAETFPSSPMIDEGIRHALASRPDVAIDYFAEYLESEGIPAEQAALALSEYVRRKFHGRKIDLVIAISDPVLRFVLDHREELFPEAPIVEMGATLPDETTRVSGAGLTGIRASVAFAETLALVLKLHPSAHDVFVVAKGLNEPLDEAVRAALSGFSQKVRLTYVSEETVPRLLSRLSEAPPGSVILYVWYSQKDKPGYLVNPAEFAPLVARAASVPVYGTSELYIGTGIVGGVVRGTRETGIRLGEMALRILAGARAQDMPIEAARLVPVFDGRAMRRWGIAERRLPPGSSVSFRGPNLWRDYRREVLTGLAVVALQSLLIAGLLYERRARRRAEAASRNSLALAADADRRFTMSALTGSIAHELSQPLSSILHNAQAGEMLVDSNRATLETVREILSEIETADLRATEIVERHRKMLRTRQLEKQSIDLHSVVRESLALVAHDRRANQVQVDLDLETAPCVVDGDPVLLQQVLVNLMMNAMQAIVEAADARRLVTVLTRHTEGGVELSVRDSGTGLPSHVDGRLFEPFVTTKTNGMGIGLTIARSIAEAHGGTMKAHNNPEGGATFTLRLPCVATGRAGPSAAARQP